MTNGNENEEEYFLYDCFITEGKYKCDVEGCPWYRMCPIRMMEYILFLENRIEDCQTLWNNKQGEKQGEKEEYNKTYLQSLFDEWCKSRQKELKIEIVKRVLKSIRDEKLEELLKEPQNELEINNYDYDEI